MAKSIAIISDIHSNPPALEAVLKSIDQENPDRIYCLGDVVGYNHAPNRAVEAIRQIADGNTVMGNHDLGVSGLNPLYLEGFSPYAKMAAEYHIDIISRDNLNWLASLPRNFQRGNLLCCHGTPHSTGRYMRSEWDFMEIAESVTDPDIDIVFFGHTHLPIIVGVDGERVEMLLNSLDRDINDVEYQLDRDELSFINPGSVGQPRDNDPRASYLLYYPEDHVVRFKRVEYDIKRARREIIKSGLPPFLAERLKRGV